MSLYSNLISRPAILTAVMFLAGTTLRAEVIFTVDHAITGNPDASDWLETVDSVSAFETEAANIALADEVSSPPAENEAGLGAAAEQLTFQAAVTGLPWSFTVTAPGSGGFTYDDTSAWSSGTLSPGGTGFGNGNDDDVVFTITGGPALYGFGFEILSNEDRNDVETVKVFGAGNVLLATLDLPSRPFGTNDDFFVGVTSSEPIVRIEFDEDSLGNDVAIRDFYFAGVAKGISSQLTVELKLDNNSYLLLDPQTRHDFGALFIGQSSSSTFRVTNVSDSALTQPEVRFEPAIPGSPFVFGGGLGDLAPGASEEFVISFTPPVVADNYSVVRVSYAESRLGRTFRIRGTGLASGPPKILHVRQGATGAADGSSWTDAFDKLQDALAAASYGDEVRIASGTYFPDEGVSQTGNDRASSFTLVDGVKLYGGFPDSGSPGFADRDPELHLTTLSGDIDQNDDSGGDNSGNAYHVLTAAAVRADTVLDGFTITAGNADFEDPLNPENFDGRSGGGLTCLDGADLTIANCVFTGNSAELGGAIDSSESSPGITGCRFINNTAGCGGALNNYLASPQITDCVFENNVATNDGGAISNNVSSDAVLTRCTFTGNASSREGGAVYNDTSAPVFSDCLFAANTSSDGSSIFNFASSPVVSDTVFENHAGGGGTVVSSNDVSAPALTRCIFRNNTTTSLRNQDAAPLVTDCVFTGNTTTVGGACLEAPNTDSRYIRCIFSNNTATNSGGAIATADNASPVFIDCTFSGNTATNFGGVIDCGFSSNVRFQGCTFSGNSVTGAPESAVPGGGAISGGNASAEIVHCVFSENTSAGSGGAIAIYKTNSSLIRKVSITNCVFAGNTAEFGGAIDNYIFSPDIHGCTFFDNSAGLSGGAINNYNSSPAITNCSFGANQEAGDGQAVSNNELSEPVLTNCIIWNDDLTAPDADASVENDPTSGATFINCLIQGWAKADLDSASVTSGGNLEPSDPLFADAANGDLHLLAGSPAIDAGSNTAITLVLDLDRKLRIANGAIDLGAYEIQTGPTPAIGIFNTVPCLSQAAKNSLLAHFDGRIGVLTAPGSSDVESWIPVDGDGNALSSMALTAMSGQNGGDPSLIAWDGEGRLGFDDTNIVDQGRFLQGVLANSGGDEMTVVWHGHYDGGNSRENFGAFAFNIGPRELSHQRDDFSGGFTIELLGAANHAGTVDITPFDGVDTVWTTIATANSHTAWAGSTDLNIQGSPTYSFSADADMVIGALNAAGFDFIGEMKQLIIFESALGEDDRLLLQEYFEGGLVPIIPQSPAVTDAGGGMFEISWSGRGVVLQHSTDLIHWETVVGAVSPLTVSPPAGGESYYRLAW